MILHVTFSASRLQPLILIAVGGKSKHRIGFERKNTYVADINPVDHPSICKAEMASVKEIPVQGGDKDSVTQRTYVIGPPRLFI